MRPHGAWTRPRAHPGSAVSGLTPVQALPDELGHDPSALHGRRAPCERPAVRIALKPLAPVFFGVAVPAVKLHPDVSDSLRHLVRSALGQRDLQRIGQSGAGVARRPRVDWGTGSLNVHHHVELSLDGLELHQGTAELLPLLNIRECAIERRLAQGETHRGVVQPLDRERGEELSEMTRSAHQVPAEDTDLIQVGVTRGIPRKPLNFS